MIQIPIFTNLIKHAARLRLRRVMQGYRYLKVKNQLDRIARVKEALTNAKINKCDGRVSKFFFGAGVNQAEIIIRQYLLIRIGGLNLNKALLCTVGKSGEGVVHPLPPIWRKVLRQHGFEVDEFRSAFMWNAYIILLFAYGLASTAKRLFNNIAEIIRPSHRNLGNHVFFENLSVRNLPQPGKDNRSHDVISWYQQWPGRLNDLEFLCHGVKGAPNTTVDGISVVSVQSAIPALSKIGALLRYIGWSIVACTLASFDFLRGRWWHALMLSEASAAALVRVHKSGALAKEYLFHNSGWIYRPLWTYDAEQQGARISFYFYSTNCEPFKRAEGYPKLPYGWEAMNWPRYLVWNQSQADFVRRAVGQKANINIVGPIWFQTSNAALSELPLNTVAVFDVQPMRDAFYQTLGIDFEYYVPKIANQFLADIYTILSEFGCNLGLKRKRKIGHMAHPRYRQLVDGFDSLPNFVAVDPDTAAVRLIEECIAVISMPFTSTALLGKELGKPSVYYDPYGLVQKDDRAAHGIEILCGLGELRSWVSSVMNPLTIMETACIISHDEQDRMDVNTT